MVKTVRISRKNADFFAARLIKNKLLISIKMPSAKKVLKTGWRVAQTAVFLYALYAGIHVYKLTKSEPFNTRYQFIKTTYETAEHISNKKSFWLYIKASTLFDKKLKNNLNELETLADKIGNTEAEWRYRTKKVFIPWTSYTRELEKLYDVKLDKNLLKSH